MVGVITIIISSPRQWLECLGSAVKIQRGGTCPKMQNVWQFGRVSHFDSLHSPKTGCYRGGKRWAAPSFSVWTLCTLRAGALPVGTPSSKVAGVPCQQCFHLRVWTHLQRADLWLRKSLCATQVLMIFFNRFKMDPAIGSTIIPIFLLTEIWATNFFFNFIFLFYLWWILSYIEMKQPWVYMCSPPIPLPPPSPPDPSRSSQCTRSERLSHASNLGWWSVSP